MNASGTAILEPTGLVVPHTAGLAERYMAVRQRTQWLCAPLLAEDCVVQSMPDASPTKWHLAHTSWFFETFVLAPNATAYAPFNSHFSYLFNSYYVTVGDRHCRQNRGLLSRPTVAEIYDYRKHVDEAMLRLLSAANESLLSRLTATIEMGLHHEQQHQELLLTDIKHAFWVNPMRPVYRERSVEREAEVTPSRWVRFGEGIQSVGYDGSGFAFDNESPRHRVFLEPFQLSSRLVTNGEYKQFIGDGGYRRPELWLSMGWATVEREQWQSPLYWIEQAGQWQNHTLAGLRPVSDDEPVCHISYFEADAYARWAGARLASEFEWETASCSLPIDGNFVDRGRLHPAPLALMPAAAGSHEEPSQMFGDVWEWTRSAYLAYPGYQPPAGALGEYNGKFMCNQFVLRGGSCATPRNHIRRTYRNFFPPDARWQFTGLRLARET
ncbi:MAG TPA: ergothioneine biosynthesis protein EgtB [Tepidisphaeraceae bacterium]|nr:ergothioneine biosynthesis protein EgtB [Tepidisphaeraceae bacterium]